MLDQGSRGGLSVAGGIRIHNVEEIRRRLELLKGRVRTNLIRRGLYAGGIVLRDEARRLVRVRSGALKKAIVAKRGDPIKGSAAISFGIANVRFVRRSSVTKQGATKTRLHRLTGKGGRGFISPRRYAHLVELGTSHSRPFSFILRAAAGKAQAAVDAMVSTMRAGLDAEIRRLKAP
jgi:HK97 gp10 family phage protein